MDEDIVKSAKNVVLKRNKEESEISRMEGRISSLEKKIDALLARST